MHSQHKHLSKLGVLKRGVFITLGAVLMAFGLEGILVPNGIIDGGVVGVALMLAHLTPISLGVYLFILNIPFLVLGYKQIGKTFTIGMLYGITVLSVATSFMHNLEPIMKEGLLATVFGGVVLGVGVGLVIRNGGVLDGAETLAILLERKLPFSVGEVIMFMNVIIFTFAMFVFSLENALYSMLTYYIAFKTIDIVVKGFDDMKSMHIISKYNEDIANAISDRLGRGVTYLDGQGVYSGDDHRVIFVAFTRLEETKMKDIIHDIDPDAFFVVTDIAEARGGQFKKRDIH